jgi:RimJ/RimL family protein N-acetyltransferase
MSKALQAITDYGFDRLGLHRVEAIIAVGNQRSSAVAERCGFRLEGTLRDFFRTEGGLGRRLVLRSCGRRETHRGPLEQEDTQPRSDRV